MSLSVVVGVFVATALVLGYRVLWHRLHLHHGFGAIRSCILSGRVVGADNDRLVLQDAAGAAREVCTGGVRVLAWPAPGAFRLLGGLRPGDPVTVLVLADTRPLEAVRIVRGAWPAPPLGRCPSSVLGVVCAIALLRLLSGPVVVEREITPLTTAPLLLDGPDPLQVQAASRRMSRAIGWVGAGAEVGWSLWDYIGSRPNVADGKRRYLYLQPVGELDGRQGQVLRFSARFLSRFTCLPVRVVQPVALAEIPDRARRIHPEWGNPQLLTGYLMHELLRWRRPYDAVGYLGITAVDIWPGQGWEAVYGQASLVERVGVLSFYRSGDVAGGPAAFRLALLRTVKVAAHETGHLLSIRHCARRDCLMSGHNDRRVADARYPVLCPACLAKLVWATRCEPEGRYRSLASFCREHGLEEEATLYAALGQLAADVWGGARQRPVLASY